MSFLQVKNVSKNIDGNYILKEINLEFEEKGLVFVVGKSGAGKSTLMNIIGQLDKCYDGQVLLDSVECNKDELSLCELRRSKIGFIFQDFNLLGDIRAEENIQLAIQLANIQSVNISSLLSVFDVEGCKEKKCKVLSGGEKQRVAIARAVCKDSKIILADEPTGNLDGENARQVFKVLKKISETRLVLVISHDMESALQYGDRVITLSDGKVVSDEIRNTEMTAYNSSPIVEKENSTTAKKNVFNIIVRQHLINNRKKNSSIIFMCAVLMLFVVLVASMINAMQNVNTSINVVLENDKVVVATDGERIDTEFIKNIEDSCKATVLYKDINIGVMAGGDYISVGYEVYLKNEFFKERMKYNNINLPSENNEIIINVALAEAFFGTVDCVGQKLQLYFSSSLIECKVAEVSETIDKDKPFMYICKDFLDELYAKIVDKDSSSLLIRSESKQNYMFLDVDVYKDSQEICFGNRPSNDNEIVINAGSVNSFISVLELNYAAVSIEDVVAGKVSEALVNDIIGKKVTITVEGDATAVGEATIVGISNNTDDSVHVYMTDNSFEVMKSPVNNKVDIYLIDRDANFEKIKAQVGQYGYAMDDRNGMKASLVASRLSVPIFIISLLSLVAFILTFLFIKLTTKINIMNQTKEIGILKALGTDDKQIRHMYLMENMFLFGCSVIPVAAILIILEVLSVNGILTYEGITVYSFNPVYCVIVFLLGIFTIFVASVTEVNKISKLNLIDILRSTN